MIKYLPMGAEVLHYFSGEPVHAGDRVQYRGEFATVVFMSDGEIEEYAPGYSDRTGSDRGITLCNDDGETRSLGEPDESLEFIDRS